LALYLSSLDKSSLAYIGIFTGAEITSEAIAAIEVWFTSAVLKIFLAERLSAEDEV